jgi:hypothetical protein
MAYFARITYEHYDTSCASIYIATRTFKKNRKKFRGGHRKYYEYQNDKALYVMATYDGINYSGLSFLLFENF